MGSTMIFFSFEQNSPYMETLRNDGDLLMFQITLNEVTSSTTTLKPLKRLKGHTSSVLIVAASPSGDEV
jgi:hypothetical protein